MTSQRSVADGNSTRETSGLNQIELAWQKSYPQFLDNGREPRPLDLRSLMFIAAFFVVSWGLSTWQGLAHLNPAISTTAIVSMASLRASSFGRAYRQYREQRDQASALASDARSREAVVAPAASSSFAPQWVLDAVTAAIADKRLPEPTTPVREKMAALAHATAILGDSWANHLSVLRWDRHELLVAEPAIRKIDELMIQELWDFVDAVGGDYLICRKSDNSSSETFRILIAQSPEVIDRYQWTIPAADIVGEALPFAARRT